MIKPRSNFRVITANFSDAQIFRSFTVVWFARVCLSENRTIIVNEPLHEKACRRGFQLVKDSNQPAQRQKIARVMKFRL